jgi:hypothetical protein
VQFVVLQYVLELLAVAAVAELFVLSNNFLGVIYCVK